MSLEGKVYKLNEDAKIDAGNYNVNFVSNGTYFKKLTSDSEGRIICTKPDNTEITIKVKGLKSFCLKIIGGGTEDDTDATKNAWMAVFAYSRSIYIPQVVMLIKKENVYILGIQNVVQ